MVPGTHPTSRTHFSAGAKRRHGFLTPLGGVRVQAPENHENGERVAYGKEALNFPRQTGIRKRLLKFT